MQLFWTCDGGRLGPPQHMRLALTLLASLLLSAEADPRKHFNDHDELHEHIELPPPSPKRTDIGHDYHHPLPLESDTDRHFRLKETMLTWYCHQPDHDVTTAACQIREWKKQLNEAKSDEERKAMNEQHKKDGKAGKFKSTTKLHYIFKYYCKNENSWHDDHNRPYHRHELDDGEDHHEVCTDPVMIKNHGRDPETVRSRPRRPPTRTSDCATSCEARRAGV